ncbi:MAG: N5-carboxyaminoimidazole ribonucleotide mutase [Candidatus Gottesmanbacteria bacterium GW2011_GWB1_43_11]|uniref:N5-carboxyaminoimidazole ribonucleotide mutase n=1 Tax=Candidatus Gottesmanbacteria bacterium GW2011_GWB1_43_11 TaxID=1618446 RepID=A0A0G1FGD2_9BACT|nr:MAG: N5-carboxyaminoimidazole ribonucleotide mutase [Candidatus Gottesmanbacteria bacterium GW2011_GWA1_42_26]KKS81681.1 MAG: N5-carboxyaminoimidazole ribonucleotide mutase [Candidatus Gottesmanbacteria bacterium GW2011_GWC1_43_10]KKS85908.1 MAG: N5-carboxyaminoimidazole ribonucleotide mutase [Candidatus Gottesmanbacteria bacterium GW2011_GWB1_43_11]
MTKVSPKNMKNNAQVGIIMGSDSDLVVMQEAAKVLEDLSIPFELTVVSAHRTPERMFEYAKTAAQRGLKVIIAGAGGAAHLPGMTAALTTLPVIGVPIQTKTMSGLDSLYSIVQMPSGVPVATVTINGAKNAGILAAEIIGAFDTKVAQRLTLLKLKMKIEVEGKAKKLERHGFEKYLKEK